MEGSRLKICFTNHDLTSFTIKTRNQHIVMGWVWCWKILGETEGLRESGKDIAWSSFCGENPHKT